MRNRWLSTAVLGLILASPAPGLWANEGGHGMGMEGKEHHWDSKKMQKELELTPDQTAKLQALMETEKTAMKTTMEANRALMKKLEEQVKNKASDTDLQATMADIRANRKSMADQMEEFRTQKDNLLTPTQQAKLMLKHMKRMQGKMGGHNKHPSHKTPTPETDMNKG